jgi:hypothetical protein
MHYIVIASHVSYTAALSSILGDLREIGWPSTSIIVSLNGCPRDAIDVASAPKVVSWASNLYEYSSFMVPAVVDAKTCCDDMFLMIHDTCRLAPDFSKKSALLFERFRRSDGTNVLWCSEGGICNLSIIDRKASDVCRTMFASMETLDKMQAIRMEHGQGETSVKNAKGIVQEFAGGRPVYHTGKTRVYSANARSRISFPNVGIEKYYVYVDAYADADAHPNAP